MLFRNTPHHSPRVRDAPDTQLTVFGCLPTRPVCRVRTASDKAQLSLQLQPRVSSTMTGFGTCSRRTELHAHRSCPPRFASASVGPTEATAGFVNTAWGTAR